MTEDGRIECTNIKKIVISNYFWSQWSVSSDFGQNKAWFMLNMIKTIKFFFLFSFVIWSIGKSPEV